MTPEQIQLLESLNKKVQEFERFMEQKQSQQIQLPLDVASVAVVGKALQDAGYSL